MEYIRRETERSIFDLKIESGPEVIFRQGKCGERISSQNPDIGEPESHDLNKLSVNNLLIVNVCSL